MTPATSSIFTYPKDESFKQYSPNSRGNAARITDRQWEPYRPLIQRMHHARQTRNQILKVLRDQGLEPSLAQLYSKMSRWGLKGYGPANSKDKEPIIAMTDFTTSTQEFGKPKQGDCQIHADDVVEDSSEDSHALSDVASCSDYHDVDTSDTVYESEGPPTYDSKEQASMDTISPCLIDNPQTWHIDVDCSANPDVSLVEVESSNSTLSDIELQKLPSDLMAFVFATSDLSEFDKHDILNEIASFLCATSSYSDAFVLFEAAYAFLKGNQGTPMALAFATVNCLRSATFIEQCQYAGSLMGEALASIRLMCSTDQFAATALSSLEAIGRELCARSELGHLSILYNEVYFSQTSLSTHRSSTSVTNEVLFNHSDPFQLTKTNDRAELFKQPTEVNNLALGRLVGKLSLWCRSALEDFNPISMLPSAGFNPSDPVSVARFSTALSCHFIRKWSFLSLAEVLAHCNELLPPNRRDAAMRLCKLAIRILSTLAVYTIYQATGMTLQSITSDSFITAETQAQYLSPLGAHLDVLSQMGSKERVVVFTAMHKTLYNRTLVYRQQMDDHCLTAHVRETGFLLAASLIRLKRELDTEVPQPAHHIIRVPTPARECDTLSRKSSDSSSSMRNLARRNLLIPGIMSKNGTSLRASWGRRLSTDSNESWNFTKVTGLPDGPSPPESVHNAMQCDNEPHDDHDVDMYASSDDEYHVMGGMNMF